MSDLLRALARRAASAPRPVVLVDGRSGTGKTTLAGRLAPLLDAELVHLDDVYPGCDGLVAASAAVVQDVLAAPDGFRRPGWRRWDWGTGLPAEWHRIDPARALVVEGCGSLSRAAAARATLRIWLDGDDAARRRRAIARDGALYAREWDRWAAQEERFIARESPRMLADVRLGLDGLDGLDETDWAGGLDGLDETDGAGGFDGLDGLDKTDGLDGAGGVGGGALRSESSVGAEPRPGAPASAVPRPGRSTGDEPRPGGRDERGSSLP